MVATGAGLVTAAEDLRAIGTAAEVGMAAGLGTAYWDGKANESEAGMTVLAAGDGMGAAPASGH